MPEVADLAIASCEVSAWTGGDRGQERGSRGAEFLAEIQVVAVETANQR